MRSKFEKNINNKNNYSYCTQSINNNKNLIINILIIPKYKNKYIK